MQVAGVAAKQDETEVAMCADIATLLTGSTVRENVAEQALRIIFPIMISYLVSSGPFGIGVCSKAIAAVTIYAAVPASLVPPGRTLTTCSDTATHAAPTYTIPAFLLSHSHEGGRQERVTLQWMCDSSSSFEVIENGEEVRFSHIAIGTVDCDLKVAIWDGITKELISEAHAAFEVQRLKIEAPDAVIAAGRLPYTTLLAGNTMARIRVELANATEVRAMPAEERAAPHVGPLIYLYALREVRRGVEEDQDPRGVVGHWELSFRAENQGAVGSSDDLPEFTRPRGSRTTLIENITTSGTISARFSPISSGSAICPGKQVGITINVVIAEVLESSFDSCDDNTIVEAVPITERFKHLYFGRWELDRQSSTAAVNHFVLHNPTSPRAQVSGLRFGVTGLRWTIRATADPDTILHSALVEVNTVVDNIFLRNHRLATVLPTIVLPHTASMRGWKVGMLPPTPEGGDTFADEKPPTQLVMASTTNASEGLESDYVLILRNLRPGTTVVYYQLASLVENVQCEPPVTKHLKVELGDVTVTANTNMKTECDAMRRDLHVTLELSQSKDFSEDPTFDEDMEALEMHLRTANRNATEPVWWLMPYVYWKQATLTDGNRRLDVHLHAVMYPPSTAISTRHPFRDLKIPHNIISGLYTPPPLPQRLPNHTAALWDTTHWVEVKPHPTFEPVAVLSARGLITLPSGAPLHEVNVAGGLVKFVIQLQKVTSLHAEMFPNAFRSHGNLTTALVESLAYCGEHFLSTSFVARQSLLTSEVLRSPWKRMKPRPQANCRLVSKHSIEVSVLANDAFTLGRNLELDMNVPKALLCGNSDPPSSVFRPPTAPPESKSPEEDEFAPYYKQNSVHVGAITIYDDPVVSVKDVSYIQECAIEGGRITLHLIIKGASFRTFPDISSFRNALSISFPEYGTSLTAADAHIAAQSGTKFNTSLMACVSQMIEQAEPKQNTVKQLSVILGACPELRMTPTDVFDALGGGVQHCDVDGCAAADYHHAASQGSARRAARTRFSEQPEKMILSIQGGAVDDSPGSEPQDIAHTVVVAPTIARVFIVPKDAVNLRNGSRRRAALKYNNYICESSIRDEGFVIGISLLGDQFQSEVGDGTVNGFNTALIHSFFTAEKTAQLDVAPQNDDENNIDAEDDELRVTSPFINYLTAIADPRYVVMINATYVEIAIPSQKQFEDVKTANGESIPSQIYRPFSPQEEITFSIPGIAVRCEGCYGSSTTFTVMGLDTPHIAFNAKENPAHPDAATVRDGVRYAVAINEEVPFEGFYRGRLRGAFPETVYAVQMCPSISLRHPKTYVELVMDGCDDPAASAPLSANSGSVKGQKLKQSKVAKDRYLWRYVAQQDDQSGRPITAAMIAQSGYESIPLSVESSSRSPREFARYCRRADFYVMACHRSTEASTGSSGGDGKENGEDGDTTSSSSSSQDISILSRRRQQSSQFSCQVTSHRRIHLRAEDVPVDPEAEVRAQQAKSDAIVAKFVFAHYFLTAAAAFSLREGIRISHILPSLWFNKSLSIAFALFVLYVMGVLVESQAGKMTVWAVLWTTVLLRHYSFFSLQYFLAAVFVAFCSTGVIRL